MVGGARGTPLRSEKLENARVRDGEVLLDAASHPLKLLTVGRELDRELIVRNLLKWSPLP